MDIRLYISITNVITIAIITYISGRNFFSYFIRKMASLTADPVMVAALIPKNITIKIATR